MNVLQKLGINTTSVPKEKDYTENQSQTKNIFGFKWSKRDTYESKAVEEAGKKWLLERYCDNDTTKLTNWLNGGRKVILDAGCGSGYSALLLFGELLREHDYLGIDISNAVNFAKERFNERGISAEFLQTSLTELPFPDECIDIIFSEGVLHHTDSTENSLTCLAKKLKTGGKFLFYVYAKKAVIREFSDDYIRKQLSSLSDEEAWETLEPLTKLGKALGELNIDVDVPEDIPFLGIKKGTINLQRFFYWNICKMYYRQEYSLEEMNHINFDWFRPLNCHRHTPEEIKQFCTRAGLEIEHINVQEAGITVVANKKIATTQQQNKRH